MAKKQDAQNQQELFQDDDELHQSAEHPSIQDREVEHPASRRQEAAGPGEAEDTASASPADINQQIESFLELLQQDVGAIDLEAVGSQINEAYEVLHRSKQSDIKEITTGLRDLKKLLQSNKATGHSVGELLEHLGEQTGDFATEADKSVVDKSGKAALKKLGRHLVKFGNTLAKAEDQESIEAINNLIDTLEDDPATLDPQVGIAAIDQWYGLLHKSEDESQQLLANSLKELKQSLKSKSKANLGELLRQVGEQTTAVGGQAARGFKRPIQRLGKLLTKMSKSVE